VQAAALRLATPDRDGRVSRQKACLTQPATLVLSRRNAQVFLNPVADVLGTVTVSHMSDVQLMRPSDPGRGCSP